MPEASDRIDEDGPRALTRRGFEVVSEIRRVRTQEEYRACVELQRATWGEQFDECVPASLLQVCQRIGGVTAGAFGRSGELLGFVFGITGVEGGRLVHWSDMLAVRSELRNAGIGRRLKEFQRASVRELGVGVIYWTFDPLVARNAHLNLNRLGAEVVEYACDMYGDSNSVLHNGLGTDRFVVAWRIESERTQPGRRLEARDVEHLPLVGGAAQDGGRPQGQWEAESRAGAEAPALRIEVPADIQRVKAASPGRAAEWRQATRAAFVSTLSRGYRVDGIYRDTTTDRCYYVLSRPGSAEPR